jgi:hypothetical protein
LCTKIKRLINVVIASGIIPAVAYAFADVETAAAVVAGEQKGTYYGRYGNPTTGGVFSIKTDTKGVPPTDFLKQII